jgi:uridine phosphorylase
VADAPYHIGFGEDDLPDGTTIALLSGDPARSELIATKHLRDGSLLARNRGLDAFHARLPGGAPVVCATSGMGAPTMSVVVNELVQVGIRTVIRIGTSGSIRDDVRAGSVVIASGALTNQGAADDIAPPQFPAVADPFLTVALAGVADDLGIERHVGVVASTDTFFEGQERSASSANQRLLRRLHGMIDEYHDLGVLSFEMEAGTLFKMGCVYGFAAGCVLAIIAERADAEHIHHHVKDAAVDRAVAVAIAGADAWSKRPAP